MPETSSADQALRRVVDLERKLTHAYQQLAERDKQIASLKAQLRKDLPYDAMGEYSD